jgi:quercetin dioxygenase-like cupin family protein
MARKVIFKEESQISSIKTSHSLGIKQVLLKKNETDSDVTQVAIGTLAPGEFVEKHFHVDMEESFYFLEGKGYYLIDGEKYPVKSGTYIHIPKDAEHYLKAEGEAPLRFIYWGIEA